MGMFHRGHSGDDMDPDRIANPEETDDPNTVLSTEDPEEAESTDYVGDIPWEGMTSEEAGDRADAMRAENMVCAICGEAITGRQRSILASYGFVHERRACSSQSKKVIR